jgi:L-fuculose-phosphate aldolase
MVERAKRLYDHGLIAGLDGNLSARLGTRFILATPSGVPKGELNPDDLVLLDVGAENARRQQVPSNPRVARARRGMMPSSEMAMHLSIYAARPDVGAIVHAHPPTAVGLTLSSDRPHLDICPESIVFLGDIGFARYATPGTPELPQSLVPLLEQSDCILLERHGAVTVAPDLPLAHQRMESLEHVAKIYVAARQLGPVEPLGDAEKAKLVGMRNQGALPEPLSSESLNINDLVSKVMDRLKS